MLLLVGLGNPGPRFADHRHNVGFLAIDAIAARYRFPAPRKRFSGLVSEGELAGHRTWLLRPQTMMNLSGQSIGEAMRYYKLAPADVLVIHDEIDLVAGKIRMKQGGGHAGHNGLRDIHRHIGDGYRRLRIGVGHPGRKEAVHKHVLSTFSKADRDWLDPLLEALAEAAPLLAEGKDSAFASKVALLLNPPEESTPPKAGSPDRQAS